MGRTSRPAPSSGLVGILCWAGMLADRPATNQFWQAAPAALPGPEALFSAPVYERGAMTLHQLRLAVGDASFFKILRQWTTRNRNGNVTTKDFIALAERISGKRLDELFQAWLYTPGKPALPLL